MQKQEAQTTPEEVGVDLDLAMKDGLMKFSGELEEAAEAEETLPAKPAGPAEKKNEEEEETATPGKGETEKRPGEEKETPGQDETEKKPRFESHEKAEEGFRNLQAKNTKTEQENARLRQELTKQKAAEKLEENRAKLKQGIVEYSQKRTKEALDAIDELDPDTNDYQDEVARIMAEKDGDINLYAIEQGQIMAPQASAAGQDERVETPAAAADELPADATPEEAKVYMEKKVEDAGLDPKDPFFLNASRLVPEKDDGGVPLTFDQQIDLVIDQTKKYHASLIAGYRKRQEKESQKKAETNQELNGPLERQTTPVVTDSEEKEPKPVSLSDAISAAQEERRL